MRKLRTVTGLPVVCGEKKIGRLLKPELSEDMKRLKGIWISAGLGFTHWIPAESLQMLGDVAVLTDCRGTRRRERHTPLFRRATTTDGNRLGAVTDAEIDDLSFTVTALEISRGLWDDLLYGRILVKRFSVDRETNDVVVEADRQGKEAAIYEERNDQRADGGHADRFGGCDCVRSDELADCPEVESEGENDRQLDF